MQRHYAHGHALHRLVLLNVCHHGAEASCKLLNVAAESLLQGNRIRKPLRHVSEVVVAAQSRETAIGRSRSEGLRAFQRHGAELIASSIAEDAWCVHNILASPPDLRNFAFMWKHDHVEEFKTASVMVFNCQQAAGGH